MLTLLWDQLGGFTRPFPGWFARWPDAESAARTLKWFEPLIIPGLLQTEDYARALLSSRVGESKEQIDAMVAARLARQGVLDRDKPPTCWFMLDEGVLRRCVGSPVVMKEQLIQLARLAQRPDIVIQVVPLHAGAHQGLNGGACVIADLPDAASVAYQDTALAGGACVEAGNTGRGVAVRDSKDQDGPRLAVSAAQWRALTRRIQRGR